MSAGSRLLMLLLNYFTPLLVAGAVSVGYLCDGGIWVGLGVIYFVPPLLCRVLFLFFGRTSGRFPAFSRPFFVWWASSQFQMVFNRFPVLEELLKILPGGYSNWLRLWGSRIGRFTYWSPGARTLDRSYLEIGDDVSVGFDVLFSPHLVTRGELCVMPVRVGDRALLGGKSVLSPGSEVGAGEMLPAMFGLAPGYLWTGGRPRRG